MPENEKSFFKYVLHDKKNKKRQYIYKKCIIIYKETQQTNEKTCAKIIKKIKNILNVPIIAGGLIDEKEDVINALKAGAEGISTTDKNLWES